MEVREKEDKSLTVQGVNRKGHEVVVTNKENSESDWLND